MRGVAVLQGACHLAALRTQILSGIHSRSHASLSRSVGRIEAHFLLREGKHQPVHGMRGFANTAWPKKSVPSAAELGMYVGAAAVAMVGVSYATVPLYRLFCAATGYGGALQGAQSVEEKLKKRQENPDTAVEKAAAERDITVWFNADVAQSMSAWKFKPTQEYVKVKPGQSTLVFFTAENTGNEAITGVSTYNVTPDRAAQYFNKIQCFCFEQQRLRPGEQIDMPVFFYLDPELATDWNCRNVDDVTLSYMFHKVSDSDADEWEDDDAPAVARTHGPGVLSTATPSQQPVVAALVPGAVVAAAG